jgi:hypothetical protein
VSFEVTSADSIQVLCLSVTAEADPAVLSRLLGNFQQLNVVPRRVIAEVGCEGLLHVRIDVAGLPEARLTVLAAKLDQIPTVIRAYWYRT